MIKLKLPIHWTIRWKVEYLWLNFYRNAHFRTLSTLKKEYTYSLFPYLKWQKLKPPISIHYIFHPSRKWQDMDNVIAIAGKFLQDALVEYEVIPNDDYLNISNISASVGEKGWFIEVIISN